MVLNGYMRQVSEVARNFIATRQGFHEYVANEVRDDFPIVDFNVSGIYDPRSFTGFTEIEEAYADLEENLSPDEQNRNIIAQKITADKMVLQILRGDQAIDPNEMFKATVGFVPELVPEEEIEGLAKALDNVLFAIAGIRYDQAHSQHYQDEFIIKDPQEIERQFKLARHSARLAVKRYVDIPSGLPIPEIFNDERISGMAYAQTDNNGKFMVGVNIHPSRRYTPEKIKRVWLHEAAHIAQGQQWQRQIRAGEMSPAAGLTSMASPENTHMESLAVISGSSLPDLAQTDEEKDRAEIQRLYSELSTAVWHNAHLKIQDGRPVKDVAEEVKQLLPFEDPELIDKLAQDCRDLPIVKIIVPSYRYAHEKASEIALIKDPERRRMVVRALYTGALTLAQVQETINAG